MKLHLSRNEGTYQITGYGADFIAVNGIRHDRSIVVTAHTLLTDWTLASVTELSEAHVTRLASLEPEVVLIGTGARTRFPSMHVLRPLIDARIGYEIMDTGAACRTYGVLSGEGRQVLAALILETPGF